MSCNLRRNFVLLAFQFLVGCASLNQRQLDAFNRQDYGEFCSLASSGTDGVSSYHLGMCYENGYAGYPKSLELAIRYYNTAARWNVREAVNSLARLNQPIPHPDKAEAWELYKLVRQAESDRAFASGLSNAFQDLGRQQREAAFQLQQQYRNPPISPLPQRCTSIVNGNIVQSSCY